MKAHNEKTWEDHKRTIIVPNLTQEDEETTRNQAFKDATKSVARLCYLYCHNSSKTKKILNLLECGLLFGAENYMKVHNDKTAKKLTLATFSPAKVLRQMDTAQQGSYNITGAGCFWSIQPLKKYKRCFLFSKSSISNAAKELEREAKELCDYKLIKNEDEGERVEYKYMGKN